jgi:organic hydroperoxide reductase OsmC/OhrA
MSTYTATVSWSRGEQAFTDGKYSRAHTWRFDGGTEVPGSSSPHVVKVPLSDEHAVDPEEAFIASLASCHMLFFLDFARRAGLRVDSYVDDAEGVLAKDAQGRMAMTVVTLRPRVAFSGEKIPTGAELDALHHKSHEECFIANSVRTEVRVEPRT